MKLSEMRGADIQNLPDTVLKNLYLEFVNDFLTVASFAEYLEVDTFKAELIIALGRELNK
jgi:hypothetical protein